MCVYSFYSLPYDRSTSSSVTSSTHSAIWCFLFQFSISSPFLKVIQQLLTSSSSSSGHFYPSLYLPFNSAFQKAVPEKT